jgi:hypothetical protein
MIDFERGAVSPSQARSQSPMGQLVEKHQMMSVPSARVSRLGCVISFRAGPVYYSAIYWEKCLLLSIQEALQREWGVRESIHTRRGISLQERLFAPGNRWNWATLISM